MNFDKRVIEILYSLVPSLEITLATANEDTEYSFADAEKYNEFINRNIKGIEFKVLQEKREELIHTLQDRIKTDFIFYCSEQNFGHQPDEITILETSNKFDALYFEGTNGINHDVTVEDIVEHLTKLEQKNPIVLTGAGFDFVEGYFINPVTDAQQLAEEMYDFCPDIVDQGVETVEALADSLKETNTFYYWWD